MPNFNKANITQKGLALNAKVNVGLTGIQFTKAAAGSGEYGPEEVMSEVTALRGQKQEFFFTRKEIKDKKTVMLRNVISNENLEEGYQIKEFGVFAQDPDEGEILYSISTAVTGQADILPAFSENGLVTMTVESYVSVFDAENVTIKTGSGAYASIEDLEALEETLAADISGKADKGTQQTVTLPASGWTGSAAPYTNTIAVPGITPANEVTVLPQFSWTVEQAEAWAGAVILSGDQAVDTLTLKAYGDKPLVDLPVTVLVGDEVTAADVQEGGE